MILDRDARRLTKRQKLTHPRLGMPHEARALSVRSQSDVASQHVGRRQVDQSSPLQRNRNDEGRPSTRAAATTTSEKVGKNRGEVARSKLGPMIGMIGTNSRPNLSEVRTRTLFPGMRFRFGLKVCQDPGRPLRDGGMTVRDDLPDRIPADAGRIDPHDPHDCGEEGRDTVEGEGDRTGGSGSETGELALPCMTSLCDAAPHHVHMRCLRVCLDFFFHLVRHWRFTHMF